LLFSGEKDLNAEERRFKPFYRNTVRSTVLVPEMI